MMTTSSNARSSHDNDVLRLIGQHLVDMGLTQTVNCLLEESGLPGLDHPLATEFKQLILAGEFDRASSMVEELVDLVIKTLQQQPQPRKQPLISMLQATNNIINNNSTTATATTKDTSSLTENGSSSHPAQNGHGHNSTPGGAPAAAINYLRASNNLESIRIRSVREMRLAISEQKFLELIDESQHLKALKCLRLEMNPLTEDVAYVQHLATLIMCKSNEQVRLKANWPGKGLQSRQALFEKLAQFVPPPVLLPPRRLKTLLGQAQQLQHEHCILHHGGEEHHYEEDLKQDHICSVDRFPLATRQELDSHEADVWYCKWSNDGTKLATAGVGGKVRIWALDGRHERLVEKFTLECKNTYSVSCLSWSPNDAHLLACGSEDRPDIWLWNINKQELHTLIAHSETSEHNDSYTTCSWHLTGDKFAASSLKGCLVIYDLDGNKITGRDGIRIQCLSFLHKDPDYVLAADTLNRIKMYAIEDMSIPSAEEDVIQERHSILSFTVDAQDKYIAVNLLEQGVHLWDFRLKTLLRVFTGVRQRDTTIYSSFSSPKSPFLASGSEDGNVYVYHLEKEQPVAILQGHSRIVNCVSWNQKYPELLASASDDRIIRLWAPMDRTEVMTTTASLLAAAQLGQATRDSNSPLCPIVGAAAAAVVAGSGAGTGGDSCHKGSAP